MKKNQNVAPITDFELALVHTVSRATFPVGSAHKRFIRDTSEHTKLSDRGRWFLAHIAQRYRRQYTLNPEQHNWVAHWLAKDATLEVDPKVDPHKLGYCCRAASGDTCVGCGDDENGFERAECEQLTLTPSAAVNGERKG